MWPRILSLPADENKLVPRPDFFLYISDTGTLAISHSLLSDINSPFLNEFLEKELAIIPQLLSMNILEVALSRFWG